jgi:ferritin-like metal-binding protein YciE
MVETFPQNARSNVPETEEQSMPKDDTRSIYITGLRNAHAMENQALSIMRPQASRIENYPEVERRLVQHIAETEDQIARLEQLLDVADEDKSSLKDMALSLAGSMAALGHTVAQDEIVKNSFANFAFENYEIAAYKSLIALATDLGETSAVSTLSQNLAEEQAMAQWLNDNIEAVTLQYASLREAGENGKK